MRLGNQCRFEKRRTCKRLAPLSTLTAGIAVVVAACSSGTSTTNVTGGASTRPAMTAQSSGSTSSGTGPRSNVTLPAASAASAGPTTTKKAGPTTTVAGASPVASAFGLDKKSLQARQLKVEAIVATCMKQQGFDYVPLDPTALVVGQQGQTVVAGLSEDEFRTQYGYGISTLYDAKPSAGVGAPTANPNIKIRASLGTADQAAYDKVLNGGNSDGTFASAVSQGDFGMLGGCNKTAAIKVFGGADVLTTLTSALDELDKRVAADPAVVKATKLYQDCLAAAGFKYANADEIDKVLHEKLTAIVGSKPGNTNYDKAALAALQQEEIRLAGVEDACDQKTKVPVELKVAAAVEKAYLDANPGLAAKANG